MSETTIRKQYDQMAAVYDQRWSGYLANTLSFLKTWSQISPEAAVLDVGCGTGEFEQLLLRENPTQQIVGVDISEKMLLVAQQKCHAYPNVEFHTASASALPFASNSFDAIISASAFHYFDDSLAALREMRRVLKPDGKIVILDWCRDYLLCKICDFVLKIFDPAYKQCYSQTEFHHLLTSAHLHVRHATRVRFGVLWGLMAFTATPQVEMEKGINESQSFSQLSV